MSESIWSRHFDSAAARNLYVIDMSRFEALKPQFVSDAFRFTPSTVTLLTQDTATKALTPVAILVSGYLGQGLQLFTRATATDGAWLYALQAAKTSITVFGIWIGHVYQAYGAGRSSFDDDPKTTLAKLGLVEADFTLDKPWDQYPVVQRLLVLWELCETYVNSYVQATYQTDAPVASDRLLRAWIEASSAADEGNIRGLPEMNSRAALASVLTSLIYRVTAHGVSRLNSRRKPRAHFRRQFPARPPAPGNPLAEPAARPQGAAGLLTQHRDDQRSSQFLFHLRLLSYEAFIPFSGVDINLLFPGGATDPRNQALIQLRNGLAEFINDYQPESPQRFQWPLNIET
jgi:hypothetical protein